MLDLFHHDALRAPDADTSTLLEALEALAALPIRRRWPFLAAVVQHARHPDPRVRARALDALASADGYPAERLVLAGLAESDGEVREAALRALTGMAQHDPTRWLHALVHPDAELRRRAVRESPESLDSSWWVHGLADPELRDVVIGRLEEALPVSSLGVLLDHVRVGHVAPERILAGLCALDWRRRLTDILVAVGKARSPALRPATTPEDLLTHALEVARNPDPLDELLGWIARAAAAGEPRAAALLEDLAGWVDENLLPQGQTRRLQASALVLLLAATEPLPALPALIALTACHSPAVFGITELPAEARQRAALLLLNGTRSLPQVPTASLDIAGWVPHAPPLALVALFRCTARDEQAQLLDQVSLKRLVDAMVAEPWPGSGLLFRRLSDDQVEIAQSLRGKLLHRHRGGAGGVIACAVQRGCPAERLLPSSLTVDLWADWVHAIDGVERVKDKRRTELAELSVARGAGSRAKLLAAMLDDERCRGPFAVAVLRQLMGLLTPVEVLRLPGNSLRDLARWDSDAQVLPWPVVQGLADAVGSRDVHPFVRTWLGVGKVEPPPMLRLEPTGLRRLEADEQQALRTASPTKFERALRPTLSGPVRGLVAALEARTQDTPPSAALCLALMLCDDPLDEVLAWLPRAGLGEHAILVEVEQRLCASFAARSDLGLLAAAWLHAWEQPLATFAEWVGRTPGGLDALLERSFSLPLPALRWVFWRAAHRLVNVRRWRPPRALLPPGRLPELCVRALTDEGDRSRARLAFPAGTEDRTRTGSAAAGLLALFSETGVDLDRWREPVTAVLGELPTEVRSPLSRWLRSSRTVSVRTTRTAPALPEEPVAELTDLRALIDLLDADHRGTAEQAVLRLLELDAGTAALVQALCEGEAVHLDLVAEAVGLLSVEAQVRLATALHGDLPPRARYLVAVGLGGHETDAIAAARVGPPGWLRRRDLRLLVEAAEDPVALATALASSPHHAVYAWAVSTLSTAPGQEGVPGLRAFLEAGADRSENARFEAALLLQAAGDDRGWPLVMAELLRRSGSRRSQPRESWSLALSEAHVLDGVEAAMVAGSHAHLMGVLRGATSRNVAPATRQQAALCVLREARADALQSAALNSLDNRRAHATAARQLAEILLWGKQQSVKLLERPYGMHLIGGADLGWTRLEERRVHVNPTALLRGDQSGAAVLRGLIVHELGHHRYNADASGRAVWKRAQERRLASLHNLVCDEHLERNLRSLDTRWGDDLKRLAAWAFQHARHATDAEVLLRRLGPWTLVALRQAGLAAARRQGAVTLGVGELLRALEATGSRFATFTRALRMGLGNRTGDPLVGEALALFDKSFRKRDNEGLWEVTLELQRLFGAETAMLEALDLHEVANGDDGEGLVEGRGVSDRTVQQELERLERLQRLDGKPDTSDGPGNPAADVINVGADIAFDRIERIVKLEPDPVAHQELARDVRRAALRLREDLATLGLAMVPVRPRVRGHRLDRSRLRSAVIKGDPRVLVSRKRVVHSDLFIGVTVDCSGSMNGRRLELARRYATLIAEACRGLPSVDLRIWGFTDSRLFDAGDANRCAAHALSTSGGNNDAAALFHAAQTALRSPRSGRLLVMISDGLPTECSTTALQALVRRLTLRHHLACAQIAVVPIQEPCFDDYIEVLETDTATAARRFGEVVRRLVTKTLGG